MSEDNKQVLENLLKGSKGIEGLWKDIEKNKNGTKQALRDAEKKLIAEIGKVSEVLREAFNDYGKSTINDNKKEDKKRMNIIQ